MVILRFSSIHDKINKIASHPDTEALYMKKICGSLLALLLLTLTVTAWGDDLRLPGGLRIIEEEAFFGDSSISSVILSEGIEEIGSYAFADSSLKQITLPASLKWISEDAFAGCDDLRVTAPLGSYAYLWAVRKDLLAPEAYPASTQVSLPATLRAGENLTVTLSGPQNAVWHNVFLIGPNVKNGVRTLRDKAGEVNWPGYELDSGEYKVIVYTVTEDYGTLPPITHTLSVTGQKAEGPTLELPESLPYTQYGAPVQMDIGVSGQLRFAIYDQKDQQIEAYDQFTDHFINIWTGYEELAEGGYITISAAALEDDLWSAWSPEYRIEITPIPQLSAPEIDLPDTVPAGKDLTFSFGSVEHADRYDVDLFLSDGTDNPPNVFYDNYFKGGTVTIPGYDLSSGNYILSVTVSTEDETYRRAVTQKEITVVGSRPAAPSLVPEKTEIYTHNDQVLVHIHAPGADGAIIQHLGPSKTGENMYSSSWSMVSLDENGDGNYTVSLYWSEPERYIGWYTGIRASVIIDGIWSEWNESVKLLVKEQETLEPAVINAPSTIQAGEDFTFSFAPVEQATTYAASVRRIYGNESIYSWFSKNDGGNILQPDMAATLPGHYLAQGTYRLTVTASSDTYGNSESEWVFSVTGTKPTAPQVTADRDVLYLNDTISFKIDSAGADAVQINAGWKIETGYIVSDSYNITVEGDQSAWTWTAYDFYHDRDWRFSFSVKKDGRWSAWKTLTYEIQDRPALAAPVIHAEDSYTAGEDFSISFDAVENAKSYQYVLRDVSGASLVWHSDITPGEQTYYGYQFQPGTYRIVITAQSTEYKSSSAEHTFTVSPNPKSAINASVDHTAIDQGESITFTIDTTGAEEVRYTTSDPFSASVIKVFSDTTTWITSPGAGTRSYRFSALIDGHWTAWSEPITVKIKETEPMPAPVLTIPESLNVGQDLTVTVEDIPGANYYQVYLLNGRGTEIASYYRNGSNGDTFTFEGYLLSAGTFKVRVYANGRNRSNESSSSLRVLSGTRPDAPEATLGSEAIYANRSFAFAVPSENAQQVAVRRYQEGSTNNVYYDKLNATSLETRWSTTLNTVGQTWHYTFAVQIDGVWSPWSSTVTVTVQEQPSLAAPVIHAENSYTAGDGFAISFDAVENADSYYVEIYNAATNLHITSYESAEPRQIAYEGYELEPVGYRLTVTARSAEYKNSKTEHIFTVLPNPTPAPSVSVDHTSVYMGERYTFTIDTTGAEELRYKRSNYSSSDQRINVLEDTTRWTTYSSSATEARYQFAVLKDGHWSSWSEPVIITVKALEPLAEPAFTLPETLTAGQDLPVQVDAVPGAKYYYIYLLSARGAQISSRTLHDAAGGTVVFDGYLLSAGVVKVRVNAYRDNGSSHSENNLRVLAGSRPDAPESEWQSGSYNPIRFTVNTQGAEQAAVRYYQVGYPNDVRYTAVDVTGEASNWYQYIGGSGSAYAFAFSVKQDGVWSPWSSGIQVTLE